jgi:hypothetical protein
MAVLSGVLQQIIKPEILKDITLDMCASILPVQLKLLTTKFEE